MWPFSLQQVNGGPGDGSRERWHRRAGGLGGTYVGDLVLGAIDGVITTFAIVAAAAGGHLGSVVVIILGFANLLADGISMAASNFLGRQSSAEYVRSRRASEEWAVDHTPGEEKDEVREIFRKRGLAGDTLDAVVEGITQSKPAWVDVMVAHELGLEEPVAPSWKHGTATLLAFVAAGMVPLMPYLFCSGDHCLQMSAISAGTALFIAGALRTLVTGVHWLRAGAEMFIVGSAAALVAYMAGLLISSVV